MVGINANFRELPGQYLFTETARRAAEWEKMNSQKSLMRLGIGDVTLPIPHAAVEAMGKACEEMGSVSGVHGYGPEQGYAFLRQSIAEVDYQKRGIRIDPDEIFVSDGAKSDCGGILDLFEPSASVALCDPVYPAYADAVALTGRAGQYDSRCGAWTELHYLPCTEENGFVPMPPEEKIDLVYLCFPNNPTGMTATGTQLKQWVDWAKDAGAVILYDGAYEAFITNPGMPHSIFEIEGAKQCAVEFRSFSKTAGFTGVRCGYTVIPKQLMRDGLSLNALWSRRQAVRFNGVSYITQRGAQALYTEEGQRQIAEHISCYHANANLIRAELLALGMDLYGGIDAPYIWLKVPGGLDSWSFFDVLLKECAVLTTPGAGFGPHGEGYIRLSAFGKPEDTEEALRRIKHYFS